MVSIALFIQILINTPVISRGTKWRNNAVDQGED